MLSKSLLLSLTASLATTALAQDAYASASAAPNVTMTTILPPADCTSGCTTIVEPCSESPTGITGSGVTPPVTGSGTYYMPSGPSATSGSGGDAPPAGYTGAASAVQVGGVLMVVAGMSPALM